MAKIRNAFSTHAKRRRAGPMKDRRIPRGGSTNKQRDIMEQAREEGYEQGFNEGFESGYHEGFADGAAEEN